jgi:hypothetical protein
MAVEVWFTRKAIDEAARMTRRWYYWPLFLIQVFYPMALVGLLVIGGGLALVKNLSSSQPDFPKASLQLLVIAAPIFAIWWLYVREVKKSGEDLARINPQRLEFGNDGLHTYEKSGATGSVPWSSFDGFREGRAVILLRTTESGAWRMIPKKTSPPEGAEQIRSAVRSRLPELR